MAVPGRIVGRAWESLGNGALFTNRIRTPPLKAASRTIHTTIQRGCCLKSSCSVANSSRLLSIRAQPLARETARAQWTRTWTSQGRGLHTSTRRRDAQAVQPPAAPATTLAKAKRVEDPAEQDEDDQDFERTEKAAQASTLNLSARLSKESDDGKSGAPSGEIWRLLRIARPELKTLSWAFLFLIISSGVTMSVPFSIGRILDVATASPEQGATLLGLPMSTFYIAFAAVLATGALANYGRIIILRIVGERVVTKLRSQLFRRTFIQNAEFFDANRVGDLISRLGSDTIIVGKSITQNLSDGLRSLVSAVAGLSMMAFMSVKLTGILAIAAPPVAIGAFFYGRAIRSLSRRIQKNLGTLTKIAEERLGNVRTSQAFAGELQEVHRYNNQTRKIFFLGRKEAYISAVFFSASGFMGNMTFLALLYVGSGLVRSGALSVGDLTSFLMYTAYAGGSLFGLSAFYSELMKGVGAASRLFELQDRYPTISPTKGEMVKAARGNIDFKGVSFAYPTRPAVQIFKDLSFSIPAGSNVAIVAPSGAGKSTVASLLLRFYDTDSGTIEIGGRDISKMNAKQLRRKIGYVGQEPVLFSGSIADNIAYGRPEASRHEIIAAARKANCQFISDFPDGMDTFAGARGTQLSGGQKQRIAIARALLKNPDILILDEATSALDAESETLVNAALAKLLEGNNTTISIAHRLSTIQRSDRIIVIGSDGMVAQTGTYKEVSEVKDGAFAKLMEWQINGGQPTKDAPGSMSRDEDHGGELTEEERLRARFEELEKEDISEHEAVEILAGKAEEGRKSQ
ncbi:ATP-binding cassette permease mdl1 [Oleoguttula sp. CCFEE 5521]